MNENPEGTPNPLNPNPAQPAAPPAPAQPAAAPAQKPMQDIKPPVSAPVRPVAPAATPVEPTAPTEPAPAPEAPAPGVSEAPVSEAQPADLEQLVQEARPDFPANEQGAVQAGGKSKKKVGLILAIALFLVAIGCAVAALLIINPFKQDDAVTKAIEKVITGNMPKNVQMKGVIDASTDDEMAVLGSVTIDLDAGISLLNKTSTAKATITADFGDESKLSFDASELTVADGDSFIKIDGLANALSGPESGGSLETTEETNCVADETGETNCTLTEEITADCEGDACAVVEDGTENIAGYLGTILSAYSDIDGKWIHIPVTTSGEWEESESILNNQTQCLVTAFQDLPKYSSSISELYKQNPFVEYSTEDLRIAKVKDPLYRISINSQKFANFSNAMQTNGFINSLRACTNDTASDDDVTASDVSEMLGSFPTIYVEIDGDYNFTRIRFEAYPDGLFTEIVADLNLSYPANINVEAPEEYVEVNEVNLPFLNSLYSVIEEPVEEEVPAEADQ